VLRRPHDLRLLLTFDSSAWYYQHLKNAQFSVVFFRDFLCFLQIHSSFFILFFKKHFFSELCAIPISFLQLQILQVNLSTCCLAFRWHHTVEIWLKPNLKMLRH
jgi:hypothetical protein